MSASAGAYILALWLRSEGFPWPFAIAAFACVASIIIDRARERHGAL